MSNPTRMCIKCRNRLLQCELIRLQYINSKLIKFSGFGRSFYICHTCKESKNTSDILLRVCKIDKKYKDQINQELKELLIYG
ncbi:DUF448 domain-containing protein [Helicobacter ibis]|uniref:DUF448 domain-containing protein n=1 Tax=Helicobacter ibis TaxID=2962633 RepID=A0ABT4VFB7_9HELI|nr:DUF448 domain-containing protein [Helicobacter ibis]MDA3969403.1 DUF448 domain-containing protein [Helicobacter ibis]